MGSISEQTEVCGQLRCPTSQQRSHLESQCLCCTQGAWLVGCTSRAHPAPGPQPTTLLPSPSNSPCLPPMAQLTQGRGGHGKGHRPSWARVQFHQEPLCGRHGPHSRGSRAFSAQGRNRQGSREGVGFHVSKGRGTAWGVGGGSQIAFARCVRRTLGLSLTLRSPRVLTCNTGPPHRAGGTQ